MRGAPSWRATHFFFARPTGAMRGMRTAPPKKKTHVAKTLTLSFLVDLYV